MITPGPWRMGYWSGRCHKPEHAGGNHPGPKGDNPCVYDREFIEATPEQGGGVAGPDGKMVMDGNRDGGVEVGDGDASLILAAPGLYAALRELLLRAEDPDLYQYDIPKLMLQMACKDAHVALAKVTP